MSLTTAEQQALLNASFEGAEAVDTLIEALRVAHPNAFHTQDSLAARRFFDQPKHELPHGGYVRALAAGMEGQ
ncbi:MULTISPECIES: hypothetical protein [Burkholderia]|jgi:hypothetical protein|uniref:hypothetical protein n=1 Tax=Burkholderia TaxID=32008 RepID=UPI000759ED10|nr:MULTISPECIES: hypothetical protein [Burkholderia]KVE13448.1 hypothetical protein WI92_14235 [Burkholderia vietnamiensis]MBJ9920576.1 hypothetical protein [Burkholderia cenocepacia]MCA3785190.1 hypothetical protein [Burkholderia sp.]MCA3793087.1 hypothetical protein [Burkholderia sp.]MCA3799634.1 hypothetical protein [Burkholderia sp.]